MGATRVDLYFSHSYAVRPVPKITLTLLDCTDVMTSYRARSQAERDFEAFGPASRFTAPIPRPFNQNHYEIYNYYTDKFYRAHDICLMGERSTLLPNDAKLVGASLPIKGCLYLQDPYGGCSDDDIIDQMDRRGFSLAQREAFENALIRRVNETSVAQVKRQSQALRRNPGQSGPR